MLADLFLVPPYPVAPTRAAWHRHYLNPQTNTILAAWESGVSLAALAAALDLSPQALTFWAVADWEDPTLATRRARWQTSRANYSSKPVRGGQ